MKYEIHNLGHGLHICPELDDCLVFSAQVVSTSLGKLLPPKNDNFDIWEASWNKTKEYGASLITKLNSGELSETQVSRRIEEFNEINTNK